MNRYGIVLAGILLVLCGLPRAGAFAEENQATGQVLATYRVDLAAFSLGELQVAASFKGRDFKLEANGRFSLLAGTLYRTSGVTTSTGTFTKLGPVPSSFTLSFKSGGKKEKRLINFAGGAVREVSITPPKKLKRRNVPVTEEQLAHVLDPLTASFLTTRSDRAGGEIDVCRQTVPVFDGRQRYDIVLTPKRVETLGNDAPAGLSGKVAVCRAKYVPLGGHRPDHPGVKFMTETDEIEVWLVAVPRTSLYVPYRVLVPTGWGSGSLTLTEIKSRFGRSS